MFGIKNPYREVKPKEFIDTEIARAQQKRLEALKGLINYKSVLDETEALLVMLYKEKEAFEKDPNNYGAHTSMQSPSFSGVYPQVHAKTA